MSWFWKTLTGYKVMAVTPKHEFTVEHIPFKQPKIKISPRSNKINGLRATAIWLDEFKELNGIVED